jgi:hypothetical protein
MKFPPRASRGDSPEKTNKTRHMNRILLTTALLSGGLLLTGCGKHDNHAGHSHGTPAASAATAKEIAAAKPYPLQVCIVTGEKLGSMGEPFVFAHQGQQIKLCCGGCEDDFKKEPAKYLAKLAKPAEPKK